jgi:hypothetical protein
MAATSLVILFPIAKAHPFRRKPEGMRSDVSTAVLRSLTAYASIVPCLPPSAIAQTEKRDFRLAQLAALR